jgi:hypothetical protein
MATCACCGSTVFFGKTVGAEKYCNDKCVSTGPILTVAKTIPEHLVKSEADKIFKSSCPSCNKAGPTDVHHSHTIWSAILLTSWSSKVQFSCKSCGVKKQALAALQSFLLGWWGIPWGILGTPFTVIRNIYGMSTKIGATEPSKDLLNQTRTILALQSIEQSRQVAAPSMVSTPA